MFRILLKLRKFTLYYKIIQSMNQLKEGMKAPPFEGRDQNGQLIRLSDYKGKKLVLFLS